ncbi:hypothetical protein SAMN05216238_10785 [Lentibacillus persicus]|uniref:Uncharacterized protein n=1 Tax=Lentibacillus persicus TaxID=640948 RepID=A0A1I1X368_9BACI|nr:hypothetical protein [Lentibacillus persicus]SFE01817.1 hypothetical protein SAMN05216238_10785 [Lentibacillus persicus]
MKSLFKRNSVNRNLAPASTAEKIATTPPIMTHTANDRVSSGLYPENDILDEQVDSNDYQVEVVLNNSEVRIILLKDESGRVQFRSIYEKRNKMLKVIDLGQGLIFKGVIAG